jgi:BirA family biotin operon repressor/biotin-[acetyl-CoA-carboxylase] ligase
VTAGDLSPEAIERALGGRWGRPFEVFSVIESTNDEARRWADEGAPEGALVVADHQTAGRGRQGRRWYSEPGIALQFSLILRPSFSTEWVGLVTTAIGVACAEAIRAATGLAATVKWPNDVLVGGRKVAGILVEARTTARGTTAIAGVGINVLAPRGRLPHDSARPASDLAGELEAAGSRRPPPERAALLAAVVAHIEDLYGSLADLSGAARVVEDASRLSAVLGRDVRVRRADGSLLEGRATSLLPTGALVVSSNGARHEIDAGEVEQLRSR